MRLRTGGILLGAWRPAARAPHTLRSSTAARRARAALETGVHAISKAGMDIGWTVRRTRFFNPLSRLAFSSEAEHSTVLYKGAAPAVTDLIGGLVDVMFTNIPASLGSIKAGQLRAIAIGSKTRSSALPELPTIAESGVPNYEAVAWYGLEAPAGTPREIIEKLQGVLVQTMKSPDTMQHLVQEGTEPVISSPDALADRIRTDVITYRNLIQTTGIHIE